MKKNGFIHESGMSKRFLLLASLLLLVFVSVVGFLWLSMEQAPPDSLDYSPWPMVGRDPRHTGRSPYKGAQKGDVKWVYDTNKIGSSSPVIESEGKVYVSFYKSKLYALNPDGSLNWTINIDNKPSSRPSSPAIGKNGTVYVGTNNGKVYAFGSSETGKESE